MKEGDISKHINHAGIYFLLGEDSNGRPTIYIGQANTRKNGKGLLQRISEHKNDENEWNEVIILTRQNDTLDAAELNYLENRFNDLAGKIKRYVIINKCEPTKGNISEEKQSEMDEFMDNRFAIVGILGMKAFVAIHDETSPSQTGGTNDKAIIFYSSRRNYPASAKLSNEGFVLLKGSHIREKLSATVSPSTTKQREQYSHQIDENFITTEDILFKSPSGAAAFVVGAHINGNDFWKTKDGKSPKAF